jgi:RNaseH domain of pPIWI_RE/pPIWI_RE module N-terminal domain/MID domain of pPIWI_RE
MLITLSYRLPRDRVHDVLGDITAYPLTTDFSDAWATLPSGQGRQPPYRSLSTGLCAATGQPVRLFGERELAQRELDAGERMLLLTDQPIGHRLEIAVAAWEQDVRGRPGISTLAPLLSDPEPARPLSDYIDFRPGGVPQAPGWVFRIAAWQVTRHLAGTALRIDGRTPISLRQDTDGNLLAWERGDLITNPAGTAHAMARITARLVTSPGTGDLVVTFSAHLSRVATSWAAVRNTWIEREARATPILRLPVRHQRRPRTDPRAAADPWQHLLSPATPKILEACELEPISLPATLPPVPGSLRPQAPASQRHPLGSGLGARFMLRLQEHITTHLPDLQPLGFERDKQITLATRLPAGTLPAQAIESTGYQNVTILCLYATAVARGRMLRELQAVAGRPLQSMPDDQAIAVSERLTVTTRHCPDMLSHGLVNRAAMLNTILSTPELAHRPGRLIAAWVETEYHPAVPIDRAGDAKRHLRRLLGHHGIPCQFLATEPLVLPPGARPRAEAAHEHAARSALQDLLRASGILDHRIPRAAAGTGLAHRFSRPALLVGVHARRQQTTDHDPPLVLTVVAIHATPDPAGTWRAVMYSDRQQQWLPLAAATADFHAGRIGDPALGRTGGKAVRTRAQLERCLADLVADEPAGLPTVIFVDAPSTRTIWPGLQDQRFGTGPMPGDTLRAAGREVAVIRSNNGSEIGRPVTRQGEGHTPRDLLQPAAPGRRLYRLQDSPHPVWLFPGVSKTYGAKGGATGARYTRWTIPERLSSQLRKPWHSYTATEIVIVSAGTWEPAALAALTARLCDQPISWDGRVVYATPLHLAVTVDKDHPDYREALSQADADLEDESGQQDEENAETA